MGQEIQRQCPTPIDVFVSAVGTAGMLTRVSMVLKETDFTTQEIALEPAESPLLTQGIKGSHSIDGIGVGFVPPILSTDNYDELRAISETRAREMSRLLAAREGIFTGTSSGLNAAAALAIGKQLGPGHTVVTVACDSGMKYLAGDLYS